MKYLLFVVIFVPVFVVVRQLLRKRGSGPK